AATSVDGRRPRADLRGRNRAGPASLAPGAWLPRTCVRASTRRPHPILRIEMLSRSFWQGILAVAVAAALAAHGSAAQVKRYNIISIVTDDQSQWSVGAYGNKEARTPNMDRLAKEGAIFRNAFVAT